MSASQDLKPREEGIKICRTRSLFSQHHILDYIDGVFISMFGSVFFLSTFSTLFAKWFERYIMRLVHLSKNITETISSIYVNLFCTSAYLEQYNIIIVSIKSYLYNLPAKLTLLVFYTMLYSQQILNLTWLTAWNSILVYDCQRHTCVL